MPPLDVMTPVKSRAWSPARTLLLALAIALLATGLPALAPAYAQNPEEARVAETRAELQAVRDELDEARSEAEDDQIALEDADRQLEAAFAAVESAQQAVTRQRSAVVDAEERLAAAEADLVAQRELMAERVDRLYRQARPDAVIQVLGARDVTEAVQQGAYMNAIGREDRAAVEVLANAERRVEAEQQALEAEEVSLANVLDEQEALLADVEEIREDRALVAAASSDLVARLQAREDHLESDAAELARLIEAQQAAAQAAQVATVSGGDGSTGGSGGGTVQSDGGSAEGDGSGGSSGGGEEPGAVDAPAAPAPPSGGGFSWPASGTVTSGFGQRWGRLHAGIDIAGGTGSPISAARGGTVIHAGTSSGYGNLVLIAHGNGFTTAYAHLSSIAVSDGQSVGTGTYLGGMGCTGSCTGTHLHFEIRGPGGAVDPMAYL